jgi:flavin reductase (DIM6/NTAB) family NADH-FMN oxidoreductase RutF
LGLESKEGGVNVPKAITEDVGKFNQHYPKIPAIITASAQGRANAMTAAWHSSISLRPPLYGVSISPKRFTYQLITESKEFGINFIPFEKASLAASVGGISGQETNKFRRLDIKKKKPSRTKVPILRDAYAAYECRLVDSKTYGDHVWVVGEIVAVHFPEEAFSPEKILHPERIKPLLYLGSDFYATIDKNSLIFIKRGI